MHFKHHNGSLIDLSSRTDVEKSLLTDWISNERRDISLESYKTNKLILVKIIVTL